MTRLTEESVNRGSVPARRPYTVRGTSHGLGLIPRLRLKLRYFLDSEALIIAGCWGFWVFMGAILIWLVSYCLYWGLVPRLF